ncbi:MAG: hypothetical protein AB7Q27_15555 [Acidimicrobiia bacterium]
MSDIHAEIGEAAAAVEAQRAELEPLATELVSAASEWASAQWEHITEKVVAASPELVKANIDRLPTLKDQLRALQADALSITGDRLTPWLIHRSTSDEELLGLANLSNWFPPPLRVSMPRLSSTKGDEPLRLLVGAIGPALDEAGLLTDQSEVEAKGRYRYALPEHAAVTTPLETYEAAVSELVARIYAQTELEKKRDSDEATRLWRDA